VENGIAPIRPAHGEYADQHNKPTHSEHRLASLLGGFSHLADELQLNGRPPEPSGCGAASFHQTFNAFQRKHQPQRYADFQQVFLAFGCFCNLGRDVPPSRLAAVLFGQMLVDQIPHIGEGRKAA
jgi:hypothetical protein